MELELKLSRQQLARMFLTSDPLVPGTVCQNGTVQHFDIMPLSAALNFAGPQEFVFQEMGSPETVITAGLLVQGDDPGLAFRALIILAAFGNETDYHFGIREFSRRGSNVTAALMDSMFAISTQRN